jgi:hypothetical protein
VSPNLIQFDLTGALAINPSNTVSLTIKPSNGQQMKLSVTDWTEPQQEIEDF